MSNSKNAITITWGIDDVYQQAGDTRLTEPEAQEVLHLMDNKHDANIGINWDVIDVWIDFVVSKREKRDHVRIKGFATPFAFKENKMELLGKILPITGNAYYGFEVILPDGTRHNLIHYYHDSVHKNGLKK
jgi:hypothetical protein